MASEPESDAISPVASWEALFRAQVGVMRVLAAEFPTDLISLNEYDVMFNLSRQPHSSVRIRDLHQLTLLTQPSISRLVDRLVSRGYVAKQEDPSDGRGTVVMLTDGGHAVYRRAAIAHAQSITTQLTGALTNAELAELARLCDRLRSGLTQPVRRT